VNPNPASIAYAESRLIWPETENMVPVLISLGFGKSPGLQERSPRSTSLFSSSLPDWVIAAADKLEQKLISSDNFMAENTQNAKAPNRAPHFIRFEKVHNAAKIPRSDDVKALTEVIERFKVHLRSIETTHQLGDITHLLIANSFYFEPFNHTRGTSSVKGMKFSNDVRFKNIN
jgi:hypothetical protein